MPAAIRLLLKGLFGLLLVALLLSRVDLGGLLRTLHAWRWPPLLGAIALFVASWPVAALRWRLFAPAVPLARLLRLTLVGQFYSIVLPGQIAGEVVKAYRVARGSADAARLGTSVLVDRIVGLVALLLVTALGLAASRSGVPAPLAVAVGILALVATGLLLVTRVPAAYALLRAPARRLRDTRLAHWGARFERLVDAWHGFTGSPALLSRSFALGLVFQLLVVGVHALVARSLGVELALADWAWVAGITSVAVLLPVSVGGLGLREGALMGCLGWLGIPAESALAISFGIFAITLLGAALGGLIELTEGRDGAHGRH